MKSFFCVKINFQIVEKTSAILGIRIGTLNERGKDRMNNETRLFSTGVMILILLLAVVAYFSVGYSSAKQIRVACVGDSITEGSGYPFQLHLMLGSNYIVGNFGVSGSTVSLDSTKPYMNESKFKKALDFNPDIIIIMLGTNDANPEITPNQTGFETDYSQLVSAFQQLEGKQLIWIVRSPPIFTDNSSYNNTILATTVLPEIDNLSDQMNLPTVDIYDTLLNHSEYFADGVHPTSEGAAVIAANVYDAITLPDGSPDDSFFTDGYLG
jgi:lysophospholipase L1-like esterase